MRKNIPEDYTEAEINALVDRELAPAMMLNKALDAVENLMSARTERNLVDRGMLPPVKHDEHPMAARLYRQFKAGSGILTKDDAWDIANELDRLHNLVRKMERR